MKRSPRTRKTSVDLSESISRQLNMYALAAGAAGVGVLALAQSVEAKIVYTATHHVIGRNSHYILDLNHDGNGDFIISNTYYCGTDLCDTFLFAKATKGTQGVAGRHSGGGWDFAYGLKRGARIGPKVLFSGVRMVVAQSGGTCSGGFGSQWCNVKNRYLGFRFKIHGKTHYGWARLSTNGGGGIKATLTGYAYETIPNKPIIAGTTKGPDSVSVQPGTTPATLGRLAQGSK
jgi:hypothetical protein